jgi:hypothetical protein
MGSWFNLGTPKIQRLSAEIPRAYGDLGSCGVETYQHLW